MTATDDHYDEWVAVRGDGCPRHALDVSTPRHEASEIALLTRVTTEYGALCFELTRERWGRLEGDVEQWDGQTTTAWGLVHVTEAAGEDGVAVIRALGVTGRPPGLEILDAATAAQMELQAAAKVVDGIRARRDALVCDAIRDGATDYRVAKALGISRVAVGDIRRRAGLPPNG